ncbi:hypothetical protein C8Q73DRAFT_195846 [Cubamyces lactineus]|nr:hypothetical protein C8Q73DRAFT_195846 [Cubamyces lactineus]
MSGAVLLQQHEIVCMCLAPRSLTRWPLTSWAQRLREQCARANSPAIRVHEFRSLPRKPRMITRLCMEPRRSPSIPRANKARHPQYRHYALVPSVVQACRALGRRQVRYSVKELAALLPRVPPTLRWLPWLPSSSARAASVSPPGKCTQQERQSAVFASFAPGAGPHVLCICPACECRSIPHCSGAKLRTVGRLRTPCKSVEKLTYLRLPRGRRVRCNGSDRIVCAMNDGAH